MKVPGLVSVTGPVSRVAVLAVSTPFGTTHDDVVGQFGPVITSWAAAGLNASPVTVIVKVPTEADVGVMSLMTGEALEEAAPAFSGIHEVFRVDRSSCVVSTIHEYVPAGIATVTDRLTGAEAPDNESFPNSRSGSVTSAMKS